MKQRIASLVLVVIALALVIPARVEAQQVIEYFFIPVQVVEINGAIYRGPSYLRWRMNPGGLDVPWSCKDYGSINNVMVCAVNAEQADLTWLAAQAGVYTWPVNLDVNLPQAERSAVTAYLEAQFIPATWILPSHTRRAALRRITGIFLYMQRLTAIINSDPTTWDVTLNTQFQNLTAEQQPAMVQAATSLGYTWDIAPTDLLRNILTDMADAWGVQPIYFGFTTL